jgi:peptidoglycan DL-endopeptidase CwlO
VHKGTRRSRAVIYVVALLAVALCAAPSAQARDLKRGAKGPRVAFVQKVLGLHVDRIYGKQTKRAVKRFQRRHGLTADGIVGPATWRALRSANARKSSSAGGGRRGAVRALQCALGIAADGVFGRQTRRAVRSFQARHGLEVDGVVGPMTRAALRGGGSRSPGGGPAPSRAITITVQSRLGIPADGVYGPQSRAAVRAFQARHGLEVDGVVGPMTLAALGVSGNAAPVGGGGSALSVARSMIGRPYAYGGISPRAFDCSGLMVYAFRQAGVTLPRTSFAQFGVGVAVSRANVQAGDLVFFNASGPGASHVGIATSNATVISATTHGVREHMISGPYWGAHYVGARRV